VLRYEKMLPPVKLRRYRLGQIESRSQEDGPNAPCSSPGSAATQDKNKKYHDPFFYYVKIARGADDKHPVVIL
jgi:hypothetical protein